MVGYGTNKLDGGEGKFLGYNEIQQRHSEVDAYRKLRTLLINKTWTMINIRLSKNGETRLSQPCCKCQDYLHKVGCKKVFYTINTNPNVVDCFAELTY